MKRLIQPISIVLLFGLTFSGSAYAQEDSEDSIKDLLECDKIANQEDKFACYQAVVEILKGSNSSTSAANTDKPEKTNTQTPRDDFGFTASELKRQKEKKSDKKLQGPKEQTYTFTRTWRDAAGKYYFLMANGQVWRETGGSHMIVPANADTVRIKKNILGGYYAFVEGMEGRRGRLKRVK
jgi:hypothetical protein